ncbi:MAG: hypothetical protein RUDDFDWM_000602, partial [Candidatus Fervidibacterota bacterium]
MLTLVNVIWQWALICALPTGGQQLSIESTRLRVVLDISGTITVTDKTANVNWRSLSIAPFSNLQKLPDGKVSFQTEARQRSGKTFPVIVTMWLEDDELVAEASVSDPKIQVGTFSFLPPLPPISPKSELLIPFYGNGIAVPVDGKEFRGRSFTAYGSLDMPWVGVTDGEVGYLLLWDGRSADDGN